MNRLARRERIELESLVSLEQAMELWAAFAIYDHAVAELGDLAPGEVVDLLADNLPLPLERCRVLAELVR